MIKAKIFNVTSGKDISDYIDSIDINMPNTHEISSMAASFTLDEKLVYDKNTIRIEIISNNTVIYTLLGDATLLETDYSYTNAKKYRYEVKERHSMLFEKIIPKTEVFFDLYLCNSKDVNNSLIHIIAKKLGISDLIVEDATFQNGTYIRVPFVIFRENDRWIDELQTLISATNSVLYISNGKLFFKVCNFNLNKTLKLDKTNIITNVNKRFNDGDNNGVKVQYDRYKRLENQVVFNLQSKIIVNQNTTTSTPVQAMRINYITSSVSNPTLTKATGYYFTREDDVSSKVEIELKQNIHYVIDEWKETQVIVKFYNPYNYKLYIDNFEIKGQPLVLYENNESVVKRKDVTQKNQENFIILAKNKYIQTLELAQYLAKLEYNRKIDNKFSYEFSSNFIPNLELNNIYNLEIEDINTKVRVVSYSINLRTANFTMRIKAEEVSNESETIITNTDSLNSNTNYVDLSSTEKKIEEAKQTLKEVQADMKSKLFRQETTPVENVKENDIWLNPKTNTWKKYYNNTWNNISENEILPSMKLYNSIETNIIKLQGTSDKVGAYLLNNGEKFGSLNGELAHVTFDKLGQFEAENPNNRVALNIKDPANPTRVKSQILLGVTDVHSDKWKDTIFAIGDESSSNRIEFKNGVLNQKINGKDITTKFNEVDNNINDVVRNTSNNLNSVKTEIDRKLTNADGKLTQLQEAYNNTVSDFSSFKTRTADNIDTVQGALQNGNFTITGRTVFDGSARFVSRGTNEVITIDNGSIDFHRDGKKLTRIKNIRYGTVSTDSKGIGVVNFEGFKQPMQVLTSIKSANFGKNMASVFCYAEHIRDTEYRFYVGGTNEDVREAKPVKVMGKEWSAKNAVNFTLLSVTGYFEGLDSRYAPISNYGAYFKKEELTEYMWRTSSRKDNLTISKKPKFNIKLKINEEILFNKDYIVDLSIATYDPPERYYFDMYNDYSSHSISSISFNKDFNILKKFSNRTNINFKIEITILESDLVVDYVKYFYGRTGSRDNPNHFYRRTVMKGTIFRLTQAHFKNFSITASAETSTISSATGSGEVQYIAMEVD